MKKRCLLLLASLLVLGACSDSSGGSSTPITPVNPRTEVDFDELEDNNYVPSEQKTGEISSFSLLSPASGVTLDALETFKWESAENADKYTIEICSSELFINDNSMIDYYIQENINATKWTVTSTLMLKNTNYYWRVIAYNKSDIKYCSDVFSFYHKAPEIEEVYFDVGEADDWQLHSVGSYADISIDNSNFFKNNQPSLKVSFKEEDTHQGIPESDGWIIVSKTIEKSIYGTDAFLFNFYYGGQDAQVFIRMVDRDNEYWFAPVMISNNAKQQVILKFSDFVQRTKDVPVGNMVFDYERIKYLEIVFEKSFGDGILLISGMKAIKFDNYRDFFIQKLDFTSYEEERWVNEGYDFEKEVTEDELTLRYYGTNSEGKPKINGYGFAKIYVNQYFYAGDAIKIKVKYTGSKGTNAVIRIYEEDTDRWSYKLPFSSLVADEYVELIIPYAAFAKSDTPGDGKRQFYNIINLQFGLEGQYGAGTLSYKDFEIVSKKDYKEEYERIVGPDGLVEDFSNYKYTSELFMSWDSSEVNKDEYMLLNDTNKIGGASNPYCGQFEYKSDMEPARYTISTSVDLGTNFSSLSIWMKDFSTKSGDSRFGYLTNYSAYVNIYIYLKSSEIYLYPLGSIDRVWKEYNIPFSSFELTNRDEVLHIPNPITGGGISKIEFTLQYFYYTIQGVPLPQYTNNNQVFVDNIYLTNDDVYSEVEKEKIVKMDGDIALVDDFEDYEDTEELEYNWNDGREYEYQHKELSNVVSSEGDSHSMAVQYKGNAESPAYYIAPAFASDVKGRALKVSLYSEKSMTIYVNIYLTIGTSNIQYRATISNSATNWTEYALGFNNFSVVSGTQRTLTANDLVHITRISFGMAYYGDNDLHQLYIDNLMFDYSLSYNTNTRRVIE